MAILRPMRGTTEEQLIYTGFDGEITYDTTLKRLRTHDGITPGGHVVASGADTPSGTLVGIGITTIHVLRQSEYDAIAEPDHETLYIIGADRIVVRSQSSTMFVSTIILTLT